MIPRATTTHRMTQPRAKISQLKRNLLSLFARLAESSDLTSNILFVCFSLFMFTFFCFFLFDNYAPSFVSLTLHLYSTQFSFLCFVPATFKLNSSLPFTICLHSKFSRVCVEAVGLSSFRLLTPIQSVKYLNKSTPSCSGQRMHRQRYHFTAAPYTSIVTGRFGSSAVAARAPSAAVFSNIISFHLATISFCPLGETSTVARRKLAVSCMLSCFPEENSTS